MEINLKRVYHPFQDWEEIPANMWGEVENKDQALRQAIKFTGNAELYGSYMMRVVRDWPVSCENALTDYTINRKAWIGHAAVALAIGVPENITRQAWGMLTNEQQRLANRQAEYAISTWEKYYRKDKGLRVEVGKQVLLEWDT